MYSKDGNLSRSNLLKIFLLVIILLNFFYFANTIYSEEPLVYDNDIVDSDELKIETIIKNDDVSYIKTIEVRPFLQDNEEFKINTSIPEIRYPEQLKIQKQFNSILIDVNDYSLYDKNGNGLFDTVEWYVSSSSVVKYNTNVDLAIVEFKSNVADRIHNENGSNVEVITSRDQNFFDTVKGDYRPINICVKPSDDSEYIYENVENTVKSFFGLNGENLFIVNNSEISFQVENQEKLLKNHNNRIYVNNNTLTYIDYYPNIDLRFTIQKGKIIEEFLLNKQLNITSISQNVTFNEPSYFRFEDDGSISFFSNDSNNLISKFYPPEMWEDKNRLTLNKDIHFEIEKINEYKYFLEKKIDERGISWLNDNNRSYPVIVDATFTDSNPTEDGHIRGTSTGSYTPDTTGNTIEIFHQESFPPGSWIAQRGYVEWDISSIPDSANVYDTDFKYEGETAEDNCKIYDIANQPSASSDSTIFNDCGDGTEFVSDFDIVASTNQIQDLGSSADTDVESRLEDDWFAIGLYCEYIPGGAIYSDDYASTPDPSLYVYYYATDPPQTTMDNIPDTAYRSDLLTITGGSTDDYEVKYVFITVHNDTDNTYWCSCLMADNGWQASCGVGCSGNHNAGADDGTFNSDDEDWTWTPDCSWADGKTYTITATARDNETQSDPTPASDTFTYSSATPNQAPWIDETSESPTNRSTEVSTQPTCSIDVMEPDLDDMMIQFWENSTGTWTHRQTNESDGSEFGYRTFTWDFSQASSENTKYWWRVRARDLYQNNTPDTNDDPGSSWSSETSAYDDDTGTYATATVARDPLYLNLSREYDISAIRIYACHAIEGKEAGNGYGTIELWDKFDQEYYTIYQGVFGTNSWVTIDNIGNVSSLTSARVSFDEIDAGKRIEGRLKEFVFVETHENVSTYHFTTEGGAIETSVDTISPYEQETNPLKINATSTGGTPDNVTLYYRHSTFNDSWWNTSWDYRKKIDISNNLDNYQMKIIIGNNTGGNISCEQHAQPDFDDIRFVNRTSGELPYWIENYTINSQAAIWVKNEYNDSYFYMYYGNSDVSNESDGETTFPSYFEDWNSDNTGDYTEDEEDTGRGKMWSIAVECYDDFRIRFRGNPIIDTAGTFGGHIDIGMSEGNDADWPNGRAFSYWSCDTDNGASSTQAGHRSTLDDGPGSNSGTIVSIDENEWYIFDMGYDYDDTEAPTRTTDSDNNEEYSYTHTANFDDGLNYFAYKCHGNSEAGSTETFTWNSNGYVDCYMKRGSTLAAEHVYVDWAFVSEYDVDGPTWDSFGSEEKWFQWDNERNPDISSPWSWAFDFPNSTGYYELYSIGKASGSDDENEPYTADAGCYYKSSGNNVPILNSFSFSNSTGSKIDNSTGLLDVNNEYIFCINVTDDDGFNDIDYVNITSWYDFGDENSNYNDTSGGNINMFLQYENTTGSANFNLLWPDDEVEIVTLNCTETFLDSNTKIINISFIPKSQIRWANSNNSWNSTEDTYDDPYSWNFNITVTDSAGDIVNNIGEYGVYKYTSIIPDIDIITAYLTPGSSAETDTISLNYSSNYDYKIRVFFEENLTNQTTGSIITIADNLVLLASGDEDDDIDTDQTYAGIFEQNAVEIINKSGVFSVDGNYQTVDVKFSVFVPLGTTTGIYTTHINTKITQK